MIASTLDTARKMSIRIKRRLYQRPWKTSRDRHGSLSEGAGARLPLPGQRASESVSESALHPALAARPRRRGAATRMRPRARSACVRADGPWILGPGGGAGTGPGPGWADPRPLVYPRAERWRRRRAQEVRSATARAHATLQSCSTSAARGDREAQECCAPWVHLSAEGL